MATKKAAKKVEATDGVYEVLSKLKHDKKVYVPGSEVTLTARQAAPLLRRNVIQPAE
jgi:hypothetical protein